MIVKSLFNGTLLIASLTGNIWGEIFQITEFTVEDDMLTLRWEGGTPPFSVRRSSDLSSLSQTPLATNLTQREYIAPYTETTQDFFYIEGQSTPLLPTGQITVLGSNDPSNADRVYVRDGAFPAAQAGDSQIAVSLFNATPLSEESRNNFMILHWDNATPDLADSVAFAQTLTYTVNGVETVLFLRNDLSLQSSNNLPTGI